MKLEPNDSQKRALRLIDYWYQNAPERVYRLGGLAGTGKTAMLSLVPRWLDLEPNHYHYCAPTNKARENLQKRLVADGMNKQVTTIHSFVLKTREYHCRECSLSQPTATRLTICHQNGGSSKCGCGLRHTRKTVVAAPKLVICDEASMVDEALYEELLSCGAEKILFVGDHGQLPPVNGELDLMKDPDYQLLDVVRQAKDSPIRNLAHEARQHGQIPCGDYGAGVLKVAYDDPRIEDLIDPKEFAAITFFRNPQKNDYNLTTSEINAMFRESLGRGPNPEPGDKVIAVWTNRKYRIPKGSPGTIQYITKVSHPIYNVAIQVDGRDEFYKAAIDVRQFTGEIKYGHYDRWNYGYALTCHEAQGSEFDAVVVFEPTEYFRTDDYDYKRWLYTAITRAKSKLIIIG